MTDTDRDLELLNAYVDGELSADARDLLEARIASDAGLARKVETLTAVKARVRALGSDMVVVQVPRMRPRFSLIAAAVAAALLCVMIAGGWIGTLAFERHRNAQDLVAQALAAHDRWSTEAMNAATPPVSIDDFRAPELTRADLRLVALLPDVRIGGKRAIQASYLGPHGCRLSLFRIPQAGTDQRLRIAHDGDAQSAEWEDKSFHFVVVSRKLDMARFAVLADVLQATTTRPDRVPARNMIAALESAHQPCNG
ncbi:anti-sigma factor family protein [Pseudaminobacter salicylatoxidans]|uniref:anti-sigma factor family protein n=1 Tax=Pseudaminobacter salicylatoxidans TaxID=93369 RepID=UPI00030E4ED5|nr:hypothetical protein [Pseudaminobacter salicylatoxidans]